MLAIVSLEKHSFSSFSREGIIIINIIIIILLIINNLVKTRKPGFMCL